MFTKSFAKYACAGDTIACDVDGFDCVARIEHDDDTTPPWQRADGHGHVTDWVRRGKNAGERVLFEDRGSFRYYNFAEAVKIAKRDGWGVTGGKRDGETDAQYAARAAEQDYEALRAWCADEWLYVGVVVTVSREDVELASSSCWGIDCNYPGSDNSYLTEIANEELPQALNEAKAKIAALCK